MTYKVLLIDDHPIILEVYKNALLQLSTLKTPDIEFEIHIAQDCDSSSFRINESIACKDYYDLVFLDVRIPSSKDKKFLCGIDLGMLLRKKSKQTKILVSTSHNDNYIVSSILKDINPDAFLVKNDLTFEVLINAIKTTIAEPPFYSKTILKLLRKQSANDFIVDSIDRRILHELSRGTKMNELPDVLPLSMAALERRKRILKDEFNVSGKGDRDLLLLAQEKGFI